jgi:hypothetical protein
MNLVTPKFGAKHERLFSKPAWELTQVPYQGSLTEEEGSVRLTSFS